MRNFARFWVVALVFSIGVACLIGCRGDITVPEPPTLNGRYVGLYTYTEVSNGTDTVYDTTQAVSFKFTSTSYSMRVEEDEDNRVFCDVDGRYELGSAGAELTYTDGSVGVHICTEGYGPEGAYSLDQTTDTTRLRHIHTTEDGVVINKLLRLVNTDL